MLQVARTIRLLNQTTGLRTATFQNREHLVVPTIMLAEGVVHPVNAPYPELVLASEFSLAPFGWNGRPVFPNHPENNGVAICGNNPKTLEAESFGQLFNVEARDKVLHAEAWLDPARAETTTDLAKQVIARAKAGEPIEVSVGAFINLEDKSGMHNGKEYHGIWRQIVPDHLAMLPEGVRGACSNEMGCGAPRTAQLHLITASGISVITTEPPVDKPRSLRERFLGFLRSMAKPSGPSDSELHRELDKALRAEEPGYLGIDEVWQQDGLVVYATAPGDEFMLWRRKFTQSDSGKVELAARKEQVEPVMSFEPVTAAGCSCPKGDKSMKTKAERIAALITGGKFKDSDKPWLEAIPEDRLDTVEGGEPPKPPVVEPPTNPPPQTLTTPPVVPPVVPPAAPVTPPAPVTAEAYIAAAPAEVRQVLEEGMRTAKERRTKLIAALKETKRCVITDAELEKKTNVELEQLVQLAGIPAPTTAVDFSIQAPPRPSGDDDKVAAPRSMKEIVGLQKETTH
jgi:hypothetical protein